MDDKSSIKSKILELKKFYDDIVGILPIEKKSYWEVHIRHLPECIEIQKMLLDDDCAVNSFDSDTADFARKFFRTQDEASEARFKSVVEEDMDALSSDLFYSWFSGIDYVYNLLDVENIYLNFEVSNELQEIASEMKRCFALEQYTAVIALCRMLVEKSLLEKCSEMKGENECYNNGKSKWKNDLIKMLSFSDDEKTKVEDIFTFCDKVMHFNKNKENRHAKELMKDTIDVVEMIFQSKKE